MFLISFDIISDKGDNKEVFTITNKTKNIIANSLRTNDLFTKVNDGQFAVLVSCQNIENTYIIIQRISMKFYNSFRSKHFRLNYNVAEAILIDNVKTK